MDINKALAMMKTMNNHTSNAPPILHHQNSNMDPEDVDLAYIIMNKPPIKYVREYFENAIENLEDSE